MHVIGRTRRLLRNPSNLALKLKTTKLQCLQNFRLSLRSLLRGRFCQTRVCTTRYSHTRQPRPRAFELQLSLHQTLCPASHHSKLPNPHFSSPQLKNYPKSELKGPTIAIELDEPQFRQTYTIHTRILTTTSGFFRGALTLFPHEYTATGTIPLHDLDSDEFEDLALWFYVGRLPPYEDVLAAESDPAAPNRPAFATSRVDVLGHLFRLWVLGDRLLVPGFQNYVVDLIVRFAAAEDARGMPRRRVAFETVAFVYEHTLLPEAPLRRLVLDVADVAFPLRKLGEDVGELSGVLSCDVWRRRMYCSWRRERGETPRERLRGENYDVDWHLYMLPSERRLPQYRET